MLHKRRPDAETSLKKLMASAARRGDANAAAIGALTTGVFEAVDGALAVRIMSRSCPNVPMLQGGSPPPMC
jgi:hypothetical protein